MAVVSDLIGILYERRRALAESTDPKDAWVKTTDQAEFRRRLDESDADWWQDRCESLRNGLGGDKLLHIVVLDGALRPTAKAEEVSRRKARSEMRRKKETPFACGLKPEDIRQSGEGQVKSWMTPKVSRQSTEDTRGKPDADLSLTGITSTGTRSSSSRRMRPTGRSSTFSLTRSIRRATHRRRTSSTRRPSSSRRADASRAFRRSTA